MPHACDPASRLESGGPSGEHTARNWHEGSEYGASVALCHGHERAARGVGAMLTRVLVIVVVVALVVAWVRRRRAAGSAPARTASTVRCARCGVYFPSTEAVQRDGRAYCSAGHAAGQS